MLCSCTAFLVSNDLIILGCDEIKVIFSGLLEIFFDRSSSLCACGECSPGWRWLLYHLVSSLLHWSSMKANNKGLLFFFLETHCKTFHDDLSLNIICKKFPYYFPLLTFNAISVTNFTWLHPKRIDRLGW